MIKIKTIKYNLSPGVGLWEIEEIIGEEKLHNFKKGGFKKMKGDYIDQVNRRNMKTLESLINIPKNL